MRVLLISANRSEINMRTVPLGMGCVAASLTQVGHKVETLDLMGLADPSAAIESAVGRLAPEAIGISIRNIDDQSMVRPHSFMPGVNGIIEGAKRLSSAPVILGGAGYSIFPEAALDDSAADMGVCGEGEEALRLLLERMEAGQTLTGIPGLYLKGKGAQGARGFVKDLDDLPLPGPDVLPAARRGEGSFPVQTRRGCPFECSYCPNTVIEGRLVRRRSPSKVVEWIARWTKEGVRQFYFVDNTFNLPASYAKELCRELAAASTGASWRSIVYPLHLDEELAALMAEGGCFEGSLGFESGCERMLKAMNKRFHLDDVRRTRATLCKYGIKAVGFVLLGGPGETRESVAESLDFAESLDVDTLMVTVGLRIYPGTALAEQARRDGVVAAGDNLLSPRFYMAEGLEDYIRETVAARAEGRRNWIVNS